MDFQGYTGKDIARRIAPTLDAEEITRTSQRVKHYAAKGFLKPISNAGGGPGHRRLYDEQSVYFAALLMHLSMYRLSDDVMAVAVEKLRTTTKEYKQAVAGATDKNIEPIFLSIPMGNVPENIKPVPFATAPETARIWAGAGRGPLFPGSIQVTMKVTELFSTVRP